MENGIFSQIRKEEGFLRFAAIGERGLGDRLPREGRIDRVGGQRLAACATGGKGESSWSGNRDEDSRNNQEPQDALGHRLDLVLRFFCAPRSKGLSG